MKGLTALLALGLLGGCTARPPTNEAYYAPPLPQQQQTFSPLAPQQIVYAPLPQQQMPERREAASSSRCAWDTERTAFAYQVLQTQMMEAALTCDQRDAYNAFVNRHRPALLDSLKQIALHFSRVTGGDGETQRDAYITELANTQAENRSPEFCQLISPVVAEALSLETGADIVQFVADRQIPNPYPITMCSSETASRD